MSLLDKNICLVLNANWIPIGIKSVRQALISMASESFQEHPVLGLDIELDSSGEIVFATPTNWEDWLVLDIRPEDEVVRTAKQAIRIPTITIARNYKDLPFRRPRLTNAAIWERDQGVCQYSGKKLSRSQGSIDHVVPRARGGENSFLNMVVADKKLNARKGHNLNSEIGLDLIRKPFTPKALPAAAFITKAEHPTWKPFLLN